MIAFVNRVYRKFIDLAPFIMLFYSAISGLISSTTSYSIVFVGLGDILGYSLFTNVLMLKIYNPKRYCTTTRFAVYGLIVMNLVSLSTILWFNLTGNDYYNPLYDTYIALIIIAAIKIYNEKK